MVTRIGLLTVLIILALCIGYIAAGQPFSKEITLEPNTGVISMLAPLFMALVGVLARDIIDMTDGPKKEKEDDYA